jgi:hypothetical protein
LNFIEKLLEKFLLLFIRLKNCLWQNGTFVKDVLWHLYVEAQTPSPHKTSFPNKPKVVEEM